MPPRRPLQKATAIKTACEQQAQAASPVGKAILDKIQKCLSRAYHANASEAEAKTALFLSQKLMSEHNVTQADLMANDGGNNKAQYGGSSIVRIEKVGGSSTRVMKEAFVSTLASAICTFFDCKNYSEDKYEFVEWCFFGIANNTVAAAVAFEMTHNLILEWACAYKGGAPTSSYRLGVADGLRAMANWEKQKELEAARREQLDVFPVDDHEKSEKRDSEKTSSSVVNHGTPCSPDEPVTSVEYELGDDSDVTSIDAGELGVQADFSKDDTEIIDLCSDVDETIDRYIKQEPTTKLAPHEMTKSPVIPDTEVKPEDESESSTAMGSRWRSEMQLVQFRATSEQVAEDYLVQNHIKLSNRRKRPASISDRYSYIRGQHDSSKINVRQRTLN